MRRGYSKKRLTPECVRGEALSYVPRFHPACQRHRDARQDNRNTRRPNERSGKARRQVRHSVEQLAAAEGVQRGNWPLVTSCNGKAPARSSRAAREWYSRRVSWGASTVRAPLCPPLCGFVSVKANLNGPTISLRGRKVKSPLYPGARAATRAAPTWLGAYRVPHDTRRCRGGACPRPREAPRAAPAWLGAYRVPHDTRHCMGGACPRPPI